MADVIHVRTSERRQFKRCPQRWFWSNVEGLTSRSPSIALWFGSGIHESLAHYYDLGSKRNNDFIDIWIEWCKSEADGTTINVDEMGEQWVDARDLGVQMLKGYVEEFGGDSNWDVIATEQDFQVMFTLDDGTKIEYDGTFDGVYREKSTGRIKLMEHKTCKAMPRGDHLILDDQAGSYWTVAATILRNKGILSKREEIYGITYNYLRKGIPDERPKNAEGHATNKPTKAHYINALINHFGEDSPPGEMEAWEVDLPKMKLSALEELASDQRLLVLGDVSKNQPSPLYWRKDIRRTRAERRTQVQRIKNEAAHMNKFRTGELPLYKNPTMDCVWDCAFFEMCGVHEQGGDVQEYKDGVYTIEDPYKAHRTKSA